MVLDLKSVCPGCLVSLCFMEQVTEKKKTAQVQPCMSIMLRVYLFKQDRADALLLRQSEVISNLHSNLSPRFQSLSLLVNHLFYSLHRTDSLLELVRCFKIHQHHHYYYKSHYLFSTNNVLKKASWHNLKWIRNNPR